MQFPFPSLKYPAAHEIDAEQRSEQGMHPPFPSVVNPEEHLGEDFILIGVFVEGIIGTHPP